MQPLLLQTADESFRNGIIGGSTPTIYAYFDFFPLEEACVFFAGKLGALVTVDDYRLAMFLDGAADGFDDKSAVQGVGVGVANDHAGCPIDDYDQIHPAPAHADIGQINPPDTGYSGLVFRSRYGYVRCCKFLLLRFGPG